jgi:hypothetical protein
MNLIKRIILYVILTLSIIFTGCSQLVKDKEIHKLWLDCKLEGVVTFEVFNSAIIGYRQIDVIKKKHVITIIDFSKPSTGKRFYVIDLDKKKLLYECLVAHGRNTGENVATNFSNKSESLKSSIGFFLTAETYVGENGYSLKLDGLEKGINDSARLREIVIHGADYVSQKFIDENGRLGRSWGCPALPLDISKEIIDIISEGSCLFIYAADSLYLEKSTFYRSHAKL